MLWNRIIDVDSELIHLTLIWRVDTHGSNVPVMAGSIFDAASSVARLGISLLGMIVVFHDVKHVERDVQRGRHH